MVGPSKSSQPGKDEISKSNVEKPRAGGRIWDIAQAEPIKHNTSADTKSFSLGRKRFDAFDIAHLS